MTQFHEGQEVEVLFQATNWWRKAKIICQDRAPGYRGWHVQFPDGTHGVFYAEHIRATPDARLLRRNEVILSDSEDEKYK